MCWEVIDGQQRIVTLRLFLKAIEDHHHAFNDNDPPFTASLNPLRAQTSDQQQLDELETINLTERADLLPMPQRGPIGAYLYFRWILWLGQDAILQEEPIPVPKTPRRSQVSCTFWQLLDDAIIAEQERNPTTTAKKSAAVDCIALAAAAKSRLKILELRHEPQIDASPERLFECLNGKRLELEQFDHVRNFVFTKTDQSVRAVIYTDLWKAVETAIEQNGPATRGSSKLDSFLYDYLISKGESGPQKGINRARGATHFSRYWTSGRHGCQSNMAAFLKTNLVPAMALWLSAKKGETLAIPGVTPRPLSRENTRVIMRINAMTAGPFTPLIMGVLLRYVGEHKPESWLNEQLKALESYAGRLLLTGRSLSPLRSLTMQIAAKCFVPDGVPLLDHLRSVMPPDNVIRSYVEQCWRRIPAEKDFGDALTPSQICAIFDAIEQQLSNSVDTHILPWHKNTNPAGFSVEHIYPRNPVKWRRDQQSWGMNDRDIKNADSLTNQLGNITVLALPANRKLQNSTLEAKQEKLRQQGVTALNCNDDWLTAAQWTPTEVTTRTHRLLDAVLRRWTLP
jgi:hypothetical protein